MNVRKIPEIVQLSLTGKCQCRCRHCGVSHINQKLDTQMPLSDIAEIFRDLSVSGTKIVDLFGGEPTLREDIFEIIRLGKDAGLMMIIETNGILLDKDFVEKLYSAGLGRVYLSLDSHIEEEHDSIRGLNGAFRKALDAMRNCRGKIPVHVSIVPRSISYFSSGDFTKFLKLCFSNGADKVRVLFPSCMGNQKETEENHISRFDEKTIVEYIPEEYRDNVYVEAEHNKLGDDSECSAKKFFCHITNNGMVFPCAYFPVSFGNIHTESITTIFNRMQSHPIMDDSDRYCPTRNMSFIKQYLPDIGRDSPFKTIKSMNKIFLGTICNNRCEGCICGPEGHGRAKEEIINDIRSAAKYKTLDLFGGDFLSRDDISEIADSIPDEISVNIYTNGRIFASSGTVDRVKSDFNINSVKINLFSLDPAEFDRVTGISGSFRETLSGIINLSKKRIPVCIYVPESKFHMKMLKHIIAAGAVSVSTYVPSNLSLSYVSEEGDVHDLLALEDSVSCFGKGKISSEKLIWMRR